MSKAYLIARIRVHDKEGFETFKQMSTPLISAYGGRLLARNPEVETLEGNQEGLVVLLECDSVCISRGNFTFQMAIKLTNWSKKNL